MINKKFHQTIGKMLETPIQTMLYFGIITLCAVCFLGVLGFAVAGFVFCKIIERGGFKGMESDQEEYEHKSSIERMGDDDHPCPSKASYDPLSKAIYGDPSDIHENSSDWYEDNPEVTKMMNPARYNAKWGNDDD